MRCPYCKDDADRVIDTRPGEDGSVTRRRRECMSCGRRYTTHERLEEAPLKVIKRNSVREPFDRSKVHAGIERAVKKRPVTPEQVDEAVDAVERAILATYEREIPSSMVGEMIMEKLRELDEVAYVRFASVYRDFQSVDQFIEEIDTMSKRGVSNHQGGK